MKRLSLLVLAGLAATAFFTRDRWVDKAPQWLAELVRTEPVTARSGAGQSGASSATGAAQDKTAQDKGGGRKGGSRQVSVITASAVAGSLPVTRETIGYVRPLASTTMASETVGVISELPVKDGASVKAGDLLVRLDNRSASAAVQQAEAALARDQATLDNSQAQLDRIQRLVESGANTKQAGDDAAATVKIAEGTVAVDQAALTADRVVLSKTELRAPFDGRIGAFSVSLGSLVQSGTAIVTITQVAPVYAEFSLAETDLDLVRQSLTAGTLKVDVRPSLARKVVKSETGPIVFIDNAIDEASANIRLRAELPNADTALWPGQSIAVTVTAGRQDDLVLVPSVAVEPRDDASIVYLVKPDNTIEVRKVQVAMRSGDMAGLREGLQPGDKVVLEGQVNLTNGTSVKDLTPKPSDKPADTLSQKPAGQPLAKDTGAVAEVKDGPA